MGFAPTRLQLSLVNVRVECVVWTWLGWATASKHPLVCIRDGAGDRTDSTITTTSVCILV